jgi:hypothetical protein
MPFRVGPGGGGTDSFPYSDNFDSYPAGPWPCASPAPNCAGANGWQLWAAAEASRSGPAGPNNGTIATGTTHSGANALRFSQMTDIVQTGSVTSGAYDVRVWTYVPSSTPHGTYTQNWVIVLNQYEPPYSAGNGFNWSVQMILDPVSGHIQDGNTAANYGTLVFDQWVEARVHIDLAADTYTTYYNNTLQYGPLGYSHAWSGTGTARIAAVDLFSEDAVGILYDDFSIQASSGCYANCDGSTTIPFLNVNDFVCFQGEFAAGNSAANCDGSTSPPVLNISDFVCFQGLFAAGCSAP